MSGPAAADGPVRAFVALDLAAEVRDRLDELCRGLAPVLPGLRRVAPAAMHLTLRFLGSTSPDAIAALAPRLAAAAAACPPATVALTGLGVFPERGRVRVLWVGLDLPETILALQRACESAAQAAGFAPEERAFLPHLTLGRWREPAPRPVLPPSDLGHAALEELVLFRSDLSPKGARYTPLSRFPLGGPA